MAKEDGLMSVLTGGWPKHAQPRWFRRGVFLELSLDTMGMLLGRASFHRVLQCRAFRLFVHVGNGA